MTCAGVWSPWLCRSAKPDHESICSGHTWQLHPADERNLRTEVRHSHAASATVDRRAPLPLQAACCTRRFKRKSVEKERFNPTASISLRRQTQQLRQAPYIPMAELLAAPLPARQKCSRCFHLRNLTAVALAGGAGLRNEEVRELNFADLLVFELDRFASRAVYRLEDVLAGAVALDDLHLALVADIKDPKNAHERYAPVVAEYRELLLTYAREYVVQRCENARSQRADARERLRDHFGPRYDALASGAYALRFPAGVFSRQTLERDHARWASARNVFGSATLSWPDGGREQVDEDIAEELLAYLISFADNFRFGRAKEIFGRAERGWTIAPVKLAWLRANPVLLGPLLLSRKGGGICEDQLRYIFEIYGWAERGFLPQSLRSNWQRFHKKFMVLTLEGGSHGLGHRNTRVTGQRYDAEDVFDLVRIARRTARAMRMFAGSSSAVSATP